VTRYAALLRAVNVSGQNRLDMASLRDRLAGLGLDDVETYLQSGNAVFTASGSSASALADVIRAELRRGLRLDVVVLVRSAAHLQRTATSNPFLRGRRDPKSLHVTFLAEPPTRGAVRALEARPATGDEFRVAGRDVFLACPGGYGRTKLTNALFERVLGVAATTRNWATVLALRDLTRR